MPCKTLFDTCNSNFMRLSHDRIFLMAAPGGTTTPQGLVIGNTFIGGIDDG